MKVIKDCNEVWTDLLVRIMEDGETHAPRGQEVKEIIGLSYEVNMVCPVITKASRKMAYGFMFGEAAWIVSGSNWLSDIAEHMKRYADFSDDQVFLNGAYGPKIAEQYTYVVDTLVADPDSRQAVINIWRERPRSSKDIPCTLSMQFFIRNGQLHSVVTMRSQDAVWGYSYDVFTFSQVANMVRILLAQRGVKVELGTLRVNVGSAHIYARHYDEIKDWLGVDTHVIEPAEAAVDLAFFQGTPKAFVELLKEYAIEFRK